MGRSHIVPWLGAVICGALFCTSVDASLFHWFAPRQNAECDHCQADASACQQPCRQCQNCQKPEKKKHFCCLRPPEPPRGRVGTSFAADPQATFPDASLQSQDDRLDRMEKDVTKLTWIVEQIMRKQNPDFGNGPPAAAPQAGPVEAPAPPKPAGTTTIDQVPPGPIPASAVISGPRRLNSVEQAVVPNSGVRITR